MRLKLLLPLVSLLAFCATAFARPLSDSLGVENHNGKQVVIYKVEKKDNYYAIGRRFHVRPKEIMSYNDNTSLTIGSVIRVPTDRPFAESAGIVLATKRKPQPGNHGGEALNGKQGQPLNAPVGSQPQNQTEQAPAAETANAGSTQYKVSAHETLYSIAKRFNTTVNEIVKLNNLPSTTLHAGQILVVQAGAAGSGQPQPPVSAPAPTENQVAKRDSTTVISTQDSSNAVPRANANRYGLYEKDERGVATWMDDDGLDANKKLVLHRTAPIGTVIRITNIMTNRTTFAKVVGRFTDNEKTRDVILVMTKNVAEALGALDRRFQVTLSYGVPNTQQQ